MLPADIDGVREIGLAKWQKDVWWPISEERFQRLTQTLWCKFDVLLAHMGEIPAHLILADIGFLNLLVQYLHACAVKAYCYETRLSLFIGRQAKSFYTPDWITIGEGHEVEWQTRDKVVHWFRRYAKQIRFSTGFRDRAAIFRSFDANVAWDLGSFDLLKREYTISQDLFCEHHYPQTLLPRHLPRSSLAAEIRNNLRSTLNDFLSDITVYCRREFQFLVDPMPIADAWLARLESLWRRYHSVLQWQRIPRQLLVSNLGKPLHRVIALGIRARGGEVLAFQHGNDMGTTFNPTLPYIEYCLCDTYVCATGKAAEFHEAVNQESEINRRRTIKFLSVDTNRYRKLWASGSRESLVRPHRTFMLVGYPMNALRYINAVGEFFIFKLDHEIRIAALLKRRGFRVIYKAHPDRLSEIEGIFDEIVDEIITEPFENSYRKADVFVFTHPLTTTFGLSLCTGCPIILIDVQGWRWNQRAYELLSRRCKMVPAWFDDNNRLSFSEDVFVKKLSELSEAINTEYLEEFMFPGK